MEAGWIQTGGGLLAQMLAGAGGGALVAVSLFKFFGERWLDARSKARADAERHRRDQELEDLRARIQRQFDRVTKLSQREFEVLPDLWMKIVDAHSAVENATVRLRTRLDLTSLPENEIVDLLNGLDVPASVRDHILAAAPRDRNRRYWRLLDRLDAIDVRNKALEAHFALARFGIFLPRDLYQQLEELKEFIWAAAIDNQMIADERDEGAATMIPDRPTDQFRKHGRAKLSEAEEAVRTRLSSTMDEATA
ncbi:MAG: hypothetical protein ACK4YT_00670 [Sphingomonas sp.]